MDRGYRVALGLGMETLVWVGHDENGDILVGDSSSDILIPPDLAEQVCERILAEARYLLDLQRELAVCHAENVRQAEKSIWGGGD